MAIECICTCGKKLSVPEEYAGKAGRCKQCGSPVAIPALNAVLPDPEFVATEIPEAVTQVVTSDDDEEALAIVREVQRVKLAANRSRDLSASDPEPWYYRFLVFYANFLILGGILVSTVLFLYALSASSQPQDKPSEAAVWPSIIWAVGILIGSLSMGAPILLAVDAARNLRAIRRSSR